MLRDVIGRAGGASAVTLIAFPGGDGTADMTRIARVAGCNVIVVPGCSPERTP